MSALEAAKNLAKVTVSGGYDASATSITLQTGHGARLPAVPFNATWWNTTDYADPSDDPNVEIVRVTARVTDALTITRAQESTAASTKNTVGKLYKMIAGATARLINQHFAGHHYNVRAYGLVGDGVTDDTAALQALITLVGQQGGGVIYFPKGCYLIAGPLQDTGAGGYNSQLYLPDVREDRAHITIELQGEVAPPTQFYHLTTTPPQPTNFSIIKSTLTGGTGTASLIAGRVPFDLLAGQGPQDNVTCNVRDLIFQVPANPSFTVLNFSDTIGNRVERVLVHTGTLSFLEVTEPTHANSYAIKCPPWNHSAECEVNSIHVVGFYTGMMTGELTTIPLSGFWACRYAVEIPRNNYPVRFGTLLVDLCQYAIKGTEGTSGNPYQQPGMANVTVDHLALEKASNIFGLPWEIPIYDVDDVLNNLHGRIRFVSVLALSIVNNHTCTKRGGSNLIISEVGEREVASLPPLPLFNSAEVGTVSTSIVAVTFDQNVKAADYTAGVTILKNGAAATISSAARHSTKSEVRYTLAAPVINTDVLHFTYAAIDGFLQNEDGLHVEDINARAILNNVGSADTVQIYDKFIDTDDQRITFHIIAPTNLPANAWVESGYAFYIKNNKAQALAGRSLQFAVTDSELSDCVIRVTIRRTAYADMAITFRYQDASHFWIAELRTLDNTFMISEINAGAYIPHASIAHTFEANRDYEIEVTLSGTSITGKLDGGNTITVTSAVFSTMTKHGIWADAYGDATFRNFWVIT